MNLTPRVIFEDQDILVIDKPAPMIVNRADTTKDVVTVQDWAEERLKIDNSNIDESRSDFLKRGGIVHRLDKETSGLLVIALNEESFINLQAQFKGREVKKVYTALAHGEVKPEEGSIDVPIGRLPWNRTKFGILAEGRESQTLYKVLEYKKFKDAKNEEILSLVELYPRTGRTHQIRVHMRHIGYPLFADELYAGRKVMKRDRKILPRHFLHASKISFKHPRSGEELSFEAPLTPDLSDFLSTLS